MTTNNSQPLLEVTDLVKHFPVRGGLLYRTVAQVHAVDGVSFGVQARQTFGLVGESGCGKSTVGRSIIRLTEPTAGRVHFDGKDVGPLKGRELKSLRRDMQIVFQDPYSALDPRMPIGEIIGEGIAIHNLANSSAERNQMVHESMELVGLRPQLTSRYPHEFSGGQRQRIGIARAIAIRPRFIVCDEPVSALDVSIQSQILNLLKDLQQRFGLTYLFIAHNLAVVRYISDHVGVMYLGKLVESAETEETFKNPLHPYTQALLSAVPEPNPKRRRDRIVLQGDLPSPIKPPPGCRFHTRCPIAMEVCQQVEPEYRDVGGEHWVACHAVGAASWRPDKVSASSR